MQANSFAILTCSVSSFAPVPAQAIYSASKKYVYYLGKSIREEMKKKGVNICLFCPGNMDTEINPKSTPNTNKIAELPYLDLKKVTRKALCKAERGKGVYTPDTFYKAYRVVAKILPSAFIIKLAGNYYEY